MTSWIPYLWKELRQSRLLGLSALGVFLGIGLVPMLIGRLHVDSGRYDDDSLMIIIQLGGPILAVLAGVYAMGREQGAVERFWRSRPIDLNRWLLSKYVVGLAIVWLACWVPILIWVILVKTVSTADAPLGGSVNRVLVYSFILSLIYSASFVLGQLVRGILHAAILAVGVMALILIMPLAVRPLNWLSVELLHRADVGALDAPSYIAFVAGVTVLSLALLWLAGILLKRGIHVDADQRTLSWSVVAILLVLAAGVAFPMGTNVPAQQTIALPVTQNGMVFGMATDGNDVLALLSSGPEHGSSKGRKYGLVRVHIGEQTSVVDEPRWFADPGQDPNLGYHADNLMWSAGNPSLAYVVVRRTVVQDRAVKERTWALCTIALNGESSDPVIHRVELTPLLDTEGVSVTACLYQGQLYVYSDYRPVRLLIFSLTNPEAPSLIRSEDLEHRIGYTGPGLGRGSPRQYRIQLAPIAELDEPARLEVTHELTPYLPWVLPGDHQILAYARDPSGATMQLMLFEKGPIQNDIVPLHPIAHRRAGAAERFLRLSSGGQLFGSGPLAVRLTGALGATAFDLRNPRRIERLGHYAAVERFSTMALLPHNRVVIAGKRLHVLDLSDRMSR